MNIGEQIEAEITHREIMDNSTSRGTHCPMVIATARILGVKNIESEYGWSKFNASNREVDYYVKNEHYRYSLTPTTNHNGKTIFRLIIEHKHYSPLWLKVWWWILGILSIKRPGIKIIFKRTL